MESMNSNVPMQSNMINSKTVDLPKLQRQLIAVDRESTYAISNGYIKAIDAMIEYLNGADVPKAVYSKVMLVMTSLVIDEADIVYLKETSQFSADSGKAIPTMTEVVFLNDIPVEFDIIESVYLYILRIARENGFYSNNGIFGDLNISGIMFDNQKNISEVYQYYVVGLDGEIQDVPSNKIAQKISTLANANGILRERLIKMVNGGKKPSKSEELDIRRKYKFNPITGSMEKRPKAINKVVYTLLANKNDAVYADLKKMLK